MSDLSPNNRADKTNRPWPRRIVKLVIVVAAAGAVAAISQMPSQKRDTAATEAPPVNVTVMTVAAEPQLADTFDLPAAIEPNRIVKVAAEVAGGIERIPPKEGCIVQTGDMLVQLNTDLIKPQVEIAKAQLSRDKIQYDRMSALIKTDAASRNDLDDATTKLATSQAQLQEVQARLQRSRIVAPITGVLNNVPVEEGEYVQAGMPVAELVETDPVKVVVQVPERDIAFFSTGQKADILADIKGQQLSLTGTTTFISKVADPQERARHGWKSPCRTKRVCCAAARSYGPV